MQDEYRDPGERDAVGNGHPGGTVTSPQASDAASSVIFIPNRETIRDFLASIATGIHLCAITPDGPLTGHYFGDDVDNATKFAVDMSKAGRNVYFSVNEPIPGCGHKPTKLQIARLGYAHVDIDPPKDGSQFDKAAVVEMLRRDNPTYINDSGNGIQALWRFDKPIDATIENVVAVEAVNRAIGHRHGGDAATWNVDRVFRVPGTPNRPNAAKARLGRTDCMAGVLHRDDSPVRPALAQLQAYFPPAPRPAPATAPLGASGQPVGIDAVLASLQRDAALWRLHVGDISAYGGDHSAADQAYVNAVAPRTGWNAELTERTWLDSPLGQREKTQQRADYRQRTIATAFRDRPADLPPIDGTAAYHAQSAAQSDPTKPHRYKLLSGAALRAMPTPEWRVKGLLPTVGLGVVYGPSTAAKTFLGIDMGMAIAEGREWFGLRTKQTYVVYVALEGRAGFSGRIQAWEKANGRDAPDGFRAILDRFKLKDRTDLGDLAEVCPHGSVVFIDTLARAGDDDENDVRERAALIDAATVLQEQIGGLVVLIAHTGKDVEKGIRGSKNLFDALDASIFVNRDGDTRSWKADKVKDGKDGIGEQFKLNIVTLGIDEDGDDITSCTIEFDREAPIEDYSKPLGGAMHIALEAFNEAAHVAGQLDADGVFAGIPAPLWREAFDRKHDGDSKDTKRRAFNRARTTLIEQGYVAKIGELFTLAGPNSANEIGMIAEIIRQRDSGT